MLEGRNFHTPHMLFDAVIILASILDCGLAKLGHDVEESMRRARDELLVFPQGLEFLPCPGRGIDDAERPRVANGVILLHCLQCVLSSMVRKSRRKWWLVLHIIFSHRDNLYLKILLKTYGTVPAILHIGIVSFFCHCSCNSLC